MNYYLMLSTSFLIAANITIGICAGTLLGYSRALRRRLSVRVDDLHLAESRAEAAEFKAKGMEGDLADSEARCRKLDQQRRDLGVELERAQEAAQEAKQRAKKIDDYEGAFVELGHDLIFIREKAKEIQSRAQAVLSRPGNLDDEQKFRNEGGA